MERGPLPPHERTWRHPSEVAAEERAILRTEAAAPSTRVFALTTGTIGLVAVAVLILTVSPQRDESPVAISATTTPATPASDGALRSLAPAALSSAAPVVPRAERFADARPTDALATPIGDGRFAVVTGRSLSGQGPESVGVRLASGRTIEAQIVAQAGDGVVLVALADAAPGHAIARHRPHDDDLVTVMVSPPVTMAYGEVGTLAVDEGVAVLDDEGAIVALCSRAGSGRGVELLEITEELAGATIGGR